MFPSWYIYSFSVVCVYFQVARLTNLLFRFTNLAKRKETTRRWWELRAESEMQDASAGFYSGKDFVMFILQTFSWNDSVLWEGWWRRWKKSYIPKPPLHMANSNLIIPIYRSAIKKVADYCVNVIEPVEEELIKVKRRWLRQCIWNRDR